MGGWVPPHFHARKGNLRCTYHCPEGGSEVCRELNSIMENVGRQEGRRVWLRVKRVRPILQTLNSKRQVGGFSAHVVQDSSSFHLVSLYPLRHCPHLCGESGLQPALCSGS